MSVLGVAGPSPSRHSHFAPAGKHQALRWCVRCALAGRRICRVCSAAFPCRTSLPGPVAPRRKQLRAPGALPQPFPAGSEQRSASSSPRDPPGKGKLVSDSVGEMDCSPKEQLISSPRSAQGDRGQGSLAGANSGSFQTAALAAGLRGFSPCETAAETPGNTQAKPFLQVPGLGDTQSSQESQLRLCVR